MEKIDVYLERVYIWKFCLAHSTGPLESWKRLLAPRVHVAESRHHRRMAWWPFPMWALRPSWLRAFGKVRHHWVRLLGNILSTGLWMYADVFNQAARCPSVLADKTVLKCFRHVYQTPLLRSNFVATRLDLLIRNTKCFLQSHGHCLFARNVAKEVGPFGATIEACIKVKIREVVYRVV